MREILFRGKRTDCGEWVEGYLNQHRGRVIFDCCCNAINANDYYINDWTEKLDTDLYGCVYKVDPETVGQFTGLTDKNGVKIFEGDIIQSLESSVTGLVQWFPEHSAFMVWCKSANEVGFLYECAYIIKVIGNIHDNPGLLEGGGCDGII